MHVHITCPDGEAKFWLEPTIALAHYYGLRTRELKQLQKLVEEKQNEIKKKWREHFAS